MCRLHRLLNDCYQVLPQCCQVHFIAQGGAEGYQRTGCIVLATVEAAINDPLHAMAQRLEEGCDQQRGGDTVTSAIALELE